MAVGAGSSHEEPALLISTRKKKDLPKASMTKRISLRNQQGQSMTEFALVLPILSLLLFGVIQFGLVFNNYLTLTDAVRAGARQAAVGRHLSDPQSSAIAAVRGAATDLRQSDLNVNVAANPGWTPGSEVTVSADYPYRISLMGLVLRSGRMHSTTKERVE